MLERRAAEQTAPRMTHQPVLTEHATAEATFGELERLTRTRLRPLRCSKVSLWSTVA